MMLNALTIDFEEWFHALPSASAAWRKGARFESRIAFASRVLLDILEAEDIKATFFVVGRLAEDQPDLIRSIAKGGHELALHGYDHSLLFTKSPYEIREELLRSKQIVEEAGGVAVKGYRAPCFSMPRNAKAVFEILASLGFLYDSSIFPVITPLYGHHGASSVPYRAHGLLEIPISTLKFCGLAVPFSGGFYFRLWPYWVIAVAIRRLNSRGQVVVTYLHPWEFDPDHPFKPGSFLEAITHYTNLRLTAPRLKRLLAEFDFGTISKVFFAADKYNEGS